MNELIQQIICVILFCIIIMWMIRKSIDLNCKLNLKVVLTFLKKIVYKTMELIWIPAVYILIKVFMGEYYIRAINIFNDNRQAILVISLLILIIELLVKYRKSKVKYFSAICKYIIIGLGLYLIIEMLLGKKVYDSNTVMFLLIIICFEELIKFHNIEYEKKSFKSLLCETEIASYNELFPTRRRQADNIINFIESYDNKERFSLLLEGEWGSGKTSLIKAIKEKKKDDYLFIFIQPMLFDNKEKLIQYFIARLKEILKEEGIYTGKDSSLEKYMKSVLKSIDSKNTLGILNIKSDSSNNDYRALKDEVQNDINTFISNKNKKIIVIVDDFDRIISKTLTEVLFFIRELIDFNGINIIILMEKKNLHDIVKGEGYTTEYLENYLEKYIDKNMVITKVDKIEIIETFIGIGINEKIEEKDQNDILEFRRNIKYLFKEMQDNIDLELKKIDETISKSTLENINSNLENNKEKNIKDKQYFLINKKKIMLESINIRVIKKIVREFLEAYKSIKLNSTIINRSEEVIKNDINFLFKFIIIKNVFIEEFKELCNTGSFSAYFDSAFFPLDNLEKKCIKIILTELNKSSNNGIDITNRYKMVDGLINSNLNNIKFISKEEGQHKLDMLGNDKFNTEDIAKLINYDSDNPLDEYESLYKIVYGEYFKCGDFEITGIRLNNINQLVIETYDKWDKFKGELLLNICLYIVDQPSRYELNYSFITRIYHELKYNIIINSNEEYNSYNILINQISTRNLNRIVEIINFALRFLGPNNQINYFTDEKRIIEQINKCLALDLKPDQNTSEDFIELVNNISNRIKECNIFKNKNKEYIVMRLKRNMETYSMIKQMEILLHEKNKHMMLKNRVLRKIDNQNDFIECSLAILENVLKEDHVFDYNDLNKCLEITQEREKLCNTSKSTDVINLLKEVCKKAEENKTPHNYDYMSVLDLHLNVEKLKNLIDNEINV